MPYLFEKANAVAHTHSVNARLAAVPSANRIVLTNSIAVRYIIVIISKHFNKFNRLLFRYFQSILDGAAQLVLPIIEGADDVVLQQAISSQPAEVSAVLIRNHGLLVWDGSWEMAIKR